MEKLMKLMIQEVHKALDTQDATIKALQQQLLIQDIQYRMIMKDLAKQVRNDVINYIKTNFPTNIHWFKEVERWVMLRK